MIETTIKKGRWQEQPLSTATSQEDIVRLERLTRNSILFHELGWIPRDWVSQIAVIVAGAK